MTRTASTMLPLETVAPDFSLPDVTTGRLVSLSDFADRSGLLVMFISRHCPYVQHIIDELARLGADYRVKDVGIVAVCANDIVTYPDDSPEALCTMVVEAGLVFPVCYDESQETAKVYTAACTPDFFLFDQNRKLVYRGQLDDSRPGTGIPVTGADLRNALDALLSGQPISAEQKPSLGCNIKWKAGNEPSYFG